MKSSESPYNKQGLYFLIGTVTFSLFFISYFSFIKNEIDLKEQVRISSSPSLKAWIVTANLLEKGQKVYQAQCALCHGLKGAGDGNPGLVPPPRNLVEGKWKEGDGSAEHLFRVLTEGIPNTSMVSFKHIPSEDRWALVHYIRSLTQNKVEDDPQRLEEFAKKNL